MVLKDGLTSSFNHDLRMTLVSSIEDVMLGKFIFPEQSKNEANDFAMGVANEKRRLRSSRRPLSLESLIEDVDELSHRRSG